MMNLTDLPEDLPVPVDDGACDHLPDAMMPGIALPSTAGRLVDLSAVAGTVVVYCYPMTGRPDVPLPEGWDRIPGARGCTPQACSFRDHHAELKARASEVFGLSTQSSDHQREAVQRLQLPFELLSDEELALSHALGLPLFTADGMTLIRRVTLIIRDGRIVKVFYPVLPPDRNADEVVAWMEENRG